MKVAIGTQNPVKVQAAENVLNDSFEEADIDAQDVDSGVSEMPTSWEEGVRGATNRAENALETGYHRLGIGMEGYTIDLNEGMFLSNWCVAVTGDGTAGHGGGEMVRLPQPVAERIRHGEELGPVMDDILGRQDVAKEEGTIGVLTQGRLHRQEAFEGALHCALAPVTQTELYGGGEL